MIENKVFATTLNLLAAALNGEPCPDFDTCLWPDVRKELEVQGVLPLVSDMLLKSALLDKEEKQYLIKMNAAHSSRFFKIMTLQTEAVNLLEENHIPVTVLKGAACAQYYDKPRARQFGDIDLLVLPEDYNKALALFREKGYTQLDAEDAFYQRHIGFSTPSGIEIELHRFFSSSSNKEQNELLDQWLFTGLSHTEKIQLEKFSAPILAPLENGIIILGHVNQHLRAGLGLRQIADWMMYVKAHLNDNFWKNQFQAKAEAIGMTYLAKTITRMCQIYLGLSAEIRWCQDADDELAEEVMLYILKKGNLGTKLNKDERATQIAIHYFTNPVKAFKYLTEGGMTHMQEAGLKPHKAFAWAYQIGHLLRRTINRTNRKELWQDLKNGTKDDALMKRIKITRE